MKAPIIMDKPTYAVRKAKPKQIAMALVSAVLLNSHMLTLAKRRGGRESTLTEKKIFRKHKQLNFKVFSKNNVVV